MLVFFIIQIILSVSLILVVLFQRSSSDGLSGLSGSGSGGGIMSSRSKMDFMTKLTMILTCLFMLNSIVLGNYVIRDHKKTGKLFEDKSEIQKSSPQKSQNVPLAE